MIRQILPALPAAALLAAACSAQTAPDGPDSVSADIVLRGAGSAGLLTLTAAPGGVVLRIEADGLPENQRNAWHGAHLHVRADCSAEDFTSAGGHINPGGAEHGLRNPEGPDNADMPNIWVDEAGSIRAEIFTPRVRLAAAADGAPALLDEDGSAFVVHFNADDHITQPIGGAGPRLLCAEIGG